ncbi:MAG: uracil-DNA glycosylase [Acidobacteria bacterium]|nr:uracil-DNA glycosylase [Acidobacteriota bacterium]MBS1866819.1 uracil-DNA glycosylase [Acidobacteriota bacterium]
MPENLPESLKQKLSERLRYYEEIGVGQLYRDRVGALPAQSSEIPAPALALLSEVEEPSLPKRETKTVPPVTPAPSRNVLPLSREEASSLFQPVTKIENDTLFKIREDLGDCKRCKLCKTRHSIVFGDGNPKAELVFVGEGPGADEDEQGLPFVGRAGKLLTQMIEAMGLQRKDVYICNVVKCRPPQNRQPERDEVEECSPFLFRQIDTIAPKAIVCLGATAAKTILQTERGISQFRGEWQEFRGRKLMATYHPAYLLRNPAAKSEVWKDLQKVMAELGLAVKRKSS